MGYPRCEYGCCVVIMGDIVEANLQSRGGSQARRLGKPH